MPALQERIRMRCCDVKLALLHRILIGTRSGSGSDVPALRIPNPSESSSSKALRKKEGRHGL